MVFFFSKDFFLNEGQYLGEILQKLKNFLIIIKMERFVILSFLIPWKIVNMV